MILKTVNIAVLTDLKLFNELQYTALVILHISAKSKCEPVNQFNPRNETESSTETKKSTHLRNVLNRSHF
jgi:phage FluMu protein Com